MTVKSPAFQFYPHDFLAGRVSTYSLEETGAYAILLAHDWTLNGLPVEELKLARLCRVSMRKFKPIWAVIGEQFPEKDGRRFNPRLALEREKQAKNRKKKQDAANSRWNAHAHAGALQMECSPSPSPVINEITGDEQTVLDHYLRAHPRRRIGKKDLPAVRKALALGYSAKDLCLAIDGNANDAWHRDKHKHELPYVLRDNGKIDTFMGLGSQPKSKVGVDAFGIPSEDMLRRLRVS